MIDAKLLKRIAAAEALVAGRGQWMKARLKDGTPIICIPSQDRKRPLLRHLVALTACDCTDFSRRLAHDPDPLPCKHMIGYRWAESLDRAQAMFGSPHPEHDASESCSRIDCPARLAIIAQCPASVGLLATKPITSEERRAGARIFDDVYGFED